MVASLISAGLWLVIIKTSTRTTPPIGYTLDEARIKMLPGNPTIFAHTHTNRNRIKMCKQINLIDVQSNEYNLHTMSAIPLNVLCWTVFRNPMPFCCELAMDCILGLVLCVEQTGRQMLPHFNLCLPFPTRSLISVLSISFIYFTIVRPYLVAQACAHNFTDFTLFLSLPLPLYVSLSSDEIANSKLNGKIQRNFLLGGCRQLTPTFVAT